MDGVLQVEKNPGLGARVSLIHQYRAPAQQISVPLKSEVQRRIQQRVPRADEGGNHYI